VTSQAFRRLENGLCSKLGMVASYYSLAQSFRVSASVCMHFNEEACNYNITNKRTKGFYQCFTIRVCFSVLNSTIVRVYSQATRGGVLAPRSPNACMNSVILKSTTRVN